MRPAKGREEMTAHTRAEHRISLTGRRRSSSEVSSLDLSERAEVFGISSGMSDSADAGSVLMWNVQNGKSRK